jgi:hypothetical protein
MISKLNIRTKVAIIYNEPLLLKSLEDYSIINFFINT